MLVFLLTLALLNAILQVAFIVGWSRLEKPERPLLKPVTLCAAAANVRSGALWLSRSVRQLMADPTQGTASDNRATLLKGIRKKVQRYV
jgi:hypothetical protein